MRKVLAAALTAGLLAVPAPAAAHTGFAKGQQPMTATRAHVRAHWIRVEHREQRRLRELRRAAAEAARELAASLPTEMAPPTEAPTEAVPASAAPSGSIEEMICSYDWDCTIAVGTSSCESGLSTTAGTPGGYYGLFQVSWETSSDAATQIAHAYGMYLRSYWHPWGYPDGAFGCYWS